MAKSRTTYIKPAITKVNNIREITFAQPKYQCSTGEWVSNLNQCRNDD